MIALIKDDSWRLHGTVSLAACIVIDEFEFATNTTNLSSKRAASEVKGLN